MGLALQGMALLAGRALGVSWLPTVVAACAAALGLWLARRAPDRPDPEARGTSSLTLGVALLAALLQPLASARDPGEVPLDLLFHAGNAAELRHRWPLEDPRVAGIPLALPPARLRASGGGRGPRRRRRSPTPCSRWRRRCGSRSSRCRPRTRGALLFGSATRRRAGRGAPRCSTPIRASCSAWGRAPSTATSRPASTAARRPSAAASCSRRSSIALDGLARGRPVPKRSPASASWRAAASAAKTTVLPVVWAGLGDRRLARALAPPAPRAAPRLLRARAPRVVGRGAAHAVAERRDGELHRIVRPGARDRLHELAFRRFARALGSEPASRAGVRSPRQASWLWLVGYLGPRGRGRGALARRGSAAAGHDAGLVAGRRRRRRSRRASSLDVPGLSQLFLLYNGQLLVCLFAGAGLVQVRSARAPRARRRGRGLLAAAACASGLAQLDARPAGAMRQGRRRGRGARVAGRARLRAGARVAAAPREPPRRGLRGQPVAVAVGVRRGAALLRDRALHRPSLAGRPRARAVAGARGASGAAAATTGRGGRRRGPARDRRRPRGCSSSPTPSSRGSTPAS